MKKHLFLRLIFFVFGLATLALGVAMTIKGQKVGVGSWDVLHVGLFLKFGLTIGTWSVLMGLLIVVVSSLILKRLPQLGTIGNMLLTGTFIDLFNSILPNTTSFALQVLYFVGGTIVLGVGAAIYMSAGLGAGPRDSLMMIAVDKLKISITIARTGMEFLVAFIGYLIGGPVGIGTLIMIFILGPVIQFAFKYSKRAFEAFTKSPMEKTI